ncbi:MAG: GNAT family N-acetyltransferase [Actinomycetota bacterium]|nr:GNAT family N-acetyltransferase [Actinomycetota bacterium]
MPTALTNRLAEIWTSTTRRASSPEVRTARMADDLRHAAELVTEHRRSLGPRGEDRTAGPVTSDVVRRCTHPHGRLLLATVGDRPVGVAAVRRAGRHSSVGRVDEVGELHWLYVRPHARASGALDLLLDRVMVATWWLGCQRLRLDADRGLGDEDRATLERLGFRSVRPDPALGGHDRRWLEVALDGEETARPA